MPYACAWVRQYRYSHDAVYPIKYVAGHPDLDVDTAQAILEWCGRFAEEDDDAIYRLRRLHHHYAEIPDRTALIRIGLDVIEAALVSRAGQFDQGNRLMQCLAVIEALVALPCRTLEERTAGERINTVSCGVIRKWAGTKIPDPGNSSLSWLMQLASADWERLVILGGGKVWDEPLRAGVRHWARWCMNFTQYEDQIPALQRLLARAEESGAQ